MGANTLSDQEQVQHLAAMTREARNAVVFTGAGISAESGAIPKSSYNEAQALWHVRASDHASFSSGDFADLQH